MVRTGTGAIFVGKTHKPGGKDAKQAGTVPASAADGRTSNGAGSFAQSYLSYLLSRASHIVASGFHKKLKTWKLTVPEYRVLACLTGAEGLGVGDLAAMAIMAAVLPLPFDPVTCTVPRPRWGSLSRDRSERTEATFIEGELEA